MASALVVDCLQGRCFCARPWSKISLGCIILFVTWRLIAVFNLHPLQHVPLLSGFGYSDCPMKQLPLRLKAPCSSMPVSPATFLYMVMGEGFPKESWVNRSEWENVSVLYTSWKVNITTKVQPRSGGTFRSTFYPNSTWATGRNHQLQEAFNWEIDQGWKFEFLIFFDEDVFLSYRHQGDPRTVIVEDNDDKAMWLFNRLLIRDRPMRAGILFNNPLPGKNTSTWTRRNFPCVRKCSVDNAVLAVHRTSVEFLLPYSPKFDTGSWWVAANLANYLAASLAPDFCNQYREVLVEAGPRQEHKNYPRNMSVFYQTYPFMIGCLKASNYSDHRTAEPGVVWQRTMLGTGMLGDTECARRHAADVNFARLLLGNLTNWPIVCV